MATLQVQLTEKNTQRIGELSLRVGKSPDELVNEAFEEYLAEIEPEKPNEDWKAALMQAAGMWKDRDDLPEMMAEIRREASRVEPPENPEAS